MFNNWKKVKRPNPHTPWLSIVSVICNVISEMLILSFQESLHLTIQQETLHAQIQYSFIIECNKLGAH